MFFDFLNPFSFLKKILVICLVIFLILIPGWIQIFADKKLSEIGKMLTKNTFQTLASVWKISFEFYKNWFNFLVKK